MNFNPHKKPISLLNVPICTQGMQRTWWPEAGTIIVTGPSSELRWLDKDDTLPQHWSPRVTCTHSSLNIPFDIAEYWAPAYKLRALTTLVPPNWACEIAHGSWGLVTKNMICAGKIPDFKEDSCNVSDLGFLSDWLIESRSRIKSSSVICVHLLALNLAITLLVNVLTPLENPVPNKNWDREESNHFGYIFGRNCSKWPPRCVDIALSIKSYSDQTS